MDRNIFQTLEVDNHKINNPPNQSNDQEAGNETDEEDFNYAFLETAYEDLPEELSSDEEYVRAELGPGVHPFDQEIGEKLFVI